VRDAPTNFGPVSVCCTAAADGLRIELGHQFRQAPQAIVIRVPWFYAVRAVEVDGQPVQLSDNTLRVSPQARLVRIAGQIKADTPASSFDQAVRDYKQDYARRYQEFLRTGVIRP
jgi:hypothetical protein